MGWLVPTAPAILPPPPAFQRLPHRERSGHSPMRLSVVACFRNPLPTDVMLSATGRFACEPAGAVEAPLHRSACFRRSREFSQSAASPAPSQAGLVETG